MLSMASGIDGAGIHMLPEPDGAIDLDDRQHLLDCYSGIAFGAGVTWVNEADDWNFKFVAADWGVRTWTMETWLKATTGTVYLRLFNNTDFVTVASSELSTAITIARVSQTTPALTLVDGKTYRAQVGKQGSDSGVGKARLVSSP